MLSAEQALLLPKLFDARLTISSTDIGLSSSSNVALLPSDSKKVFTKSSLSLLVSCLS
jgi:hypothetical protein